MDEISDGFFIQISDKHTQKANEQNKVDGKVVSNDIGHLKTDSNSQVKKQTKRNKISDMVRCQLVDIVATVESSVHDAILSAWSI